MKFLHFGHAAKPLFGTMHRPQRLQAPRAAVVLCNPFGEEAVRAHRIYRVLATQLERKGYIVLRFDYRGTGDSAGAATDVTLAGWLDDITQAVDQARETSRTSKLVLFGLAFGGTLAALASRTVAPKHLVLWDPVLSGASYLTELAAGHRSYMRAERGTAYRDRLPVTRDGQPLEALGTPIPDDLRVAIAAIDLAAEELRAERLSVVTTTPLGSIHEAFRARQPATSTVWIEAASKVPWNSDAALNDQVVPMGVVMKVIERIEEVCP